MLDRLGAEQVKRVAALARAARLARDRMLDKVSGDQFGEPKPARGEHNPSAALGLDPLSPDHPAYAALQAALDELPPAARDELRALTWIGRGDYARKEWERAVADANAALGTGTTDPLLAQADLDVHLTKGLYELGLA